MNKNMFGKKVNYDVRNCAYHNIGLLGKTNHKVLCTV